MADEPIESKIDLAHELQRRHGWYAKNWDPPDLDPAKVPEPLRHLIPMARRWGIPIDDMRHDAGQQATDTERAELREQLQGTHAHYEDWAFGALPPPGEGTVECWLFGHLYRFELEACQGPGIRSKLHWALDRFQAQPSAANREHLQSALDILLTRGRGYVKLRQTEINLAQELLSQSGPESPSDQKSR